MNFLLAGLNIRHAPVEILERVSLTPHNLPQFLPRLASHAGGGVILSTCNRTEIYGMSGDVETGLQRLIECLEMLAARGDGPAPDVRPYVYTLSGDDVARHLFKVTTGLESLAIGEAQVAGQVSRALQAAGEAGVVEPRLSRMFHAALRASRGIREDTGIGRDRISISSIGVQLMERTAGDLGTKTALLVGAGETGHLTARTLRHIGVGKLLVTSRRTGRAAALAEDLDAEAVPYEDMPAAVAASDVVITCTAATEPVVSRDVIAGAMRDRPDRPLFIMDVGMPRDVEPSAGDVPGVSLYSLEKLQAIAEEHRANRQEAAGEAEDMIEREVQRFKERLTGIKSEPVIRSLGARAESMRRQELERTLRRLPELSPDQAEIVEAMSRALVKRILADPITYLRSSRHSDAAEAVLQVFDLYSEDDDDE
ncbi:MAG: glutamyl-tRNA reductase [Dehalococcoidia bacterium]